MNERIKLYERKTGEKFERDERFTLFYLPDKGFAEIADVGNMIMVNRMCGELKFWREYVEKLSQELGYKTAGTICIRNIKAYLRLTNFVPYKIEKTLQGNRYFCKDKHTGQKGLASPAGEGTYYITWEVNS